MTRDISVKKELNESNEFPEEDFEIPMPSSCMMDLGISISGNFKAPTPFTLSNEETKEYESDEEL